MAATKLSTSSSLAELVTRKLALEKERLAQRAKESRWGMDDLWWTWPLRKREKGRGWSEPAATTPAVRLMSSPGAWA